MGRRRDVGDGLGGAAIALNEKHQREGLRREG
jgi:hypothetical protein